MKRVYALYRVSTAKQVDHVTCGNTTKDDIPMQRIACHNFAERQQDWEIIREFEEKGVSGFKVSERIETPYKTSKKSHCTKSLTCCLCSCLTDSAESKTRHLSSFSGSQNMA